VVLEWLNPDTEHSIAHVQRVSNIISNYNLERTKSGILKRRWLKYICRYKLDICGRNYASLFQHKLLMKKLQFFSVFIIIIIIINIKDLTL